MNHNQPLTQEQREFAAEKHDLIYGFLRYKRLNFDEYYDIAVFGFLKAVRNYIERPELQRYSFVTIANYSMRSELINHYRKEAVRKKSFLEVSIYTPVSDKDRLMDVIPTKDSTADNLIYQSLLNKISGLLSNEQCGLVKIY